MAYSLEARRVFWRAWRQGLGVPAAARRAGVSSAVGWRWVRQRGGMPDVDLVGPRGSSRRRLTLAEREWIAVRLRERASLAQIARELGRPTSTVSRELARNAEGGWRSKYFATRAEYLTQRRARRPKPAKLAVHEPLREYVQARLDGPGRWSPEQIAARLRVDFPDDERMRISHEAIYQALYVQGRGALRRELTVCLRTGRAVRRPKRTPTGGRRRRPAPPPELMISARPAEVEDRAVPGHWEGDLIVGRAQGGAAIGTLVERTTRYVMLLHLPDGHTGEQVRDAMTTTITTLPAALRQTLTWDQGVEMARHAEITLATGLDIYFCDPHSPWQRGTNENTNGLLRQYFPKGSDLSVHTPADLAAVADGLNGRPRKTLGWATPTEALNHLLLTAQDQPVAPTA
ncbi:IS30 family transposase [Kineosporia sp. A_224]|uniref:IS30 family transposase n=1 Tax=Kineosporia sp. A_224 TaxID=1962180 RepID=UPI00350ED23D